MESPALKKILELIPAAVGELTAAFVSKNEFNERAQIKQYMKELLDVAAVDTKHPPIPAKNQPANAFGDDMADNGAPMPMLGQYHPPRPAIAFGGAQLVANPPRAEPLPDPVPDNHVYPVPGVPA